MKRSGEDEKYCEKRWEHWKEQDGEDEESIKEQVDVFGGEDNSYKQTTGRQRTKLEKGIEVYILSIQLTQ